MDYYPFIYKYTIEDALALGKVYDDLVGYDKIAKIDPDPKLSYANLMRSILNEFERNVPEAILEFLRAYVLWLPPDAEQQVIQWINYPEDVIDNPLSELITKWHERING